MKSIFLLIACLFLVLESRGQEADTAALSGDLLIRQLRDPSQVSVGNGLGTVDSVFYEARVFAYYYVRLKPGKLLWEVSPGMHVRSVTRKSYPIPMPSFYVRSTLYYFPAQPENGKPWKYWSGQWSHHSNGKEAATILNGQPNVAGQGSFGTNFLWVGMHRVSKVMAGSKPWGLSQYYGFGYNPDVVDNAQFRALYDDVRVAYRLQFFNRLQEDQLLKHEWRFYLDASLFLEKFSMERLTGGHSSSLKLTASWNPFPNFDGAFFGQFYWGEEPYNLSFQQSIWQMQIGFLANPTTRNLMKNAKRF